METGKNTHWLFTMTRSLIQGCKTTAKDGTTLFTPDGAASYNALWLRDFAYMTEYAADFFTSKEILDCIEFALAGRREDGWLPDRVYGDRTAVYAAGACGAPIGEANLDNTPFLIFTVYFFLKSRNDSALYEKWLPLLINGLKIIPKAENGLIYNDKNSIHSPYGFTDTVAKSGLLFMESLLYWRACRMLSELNYQYKGTRLAEFDHEAERIVSAIGTLCDPETGMFFAAGEDCRQIDIWGNAYGLYIDFPFPPNTKERILDYLVSHVESYTYKGHIRHLLKGEYWQKLLIPVEQGTYQNGAFWATATGWIAWCLAQKNVPLAENLVRECLTYFREQGVFECINTNYAKLNSFVVSATNVFGAVKRISAEIPGFSVEGET